MKRIRRIAAGIGLVGALVMTLQPAASYVIWGSRTVDTGRYVVGVAYCLDTKAPRCAYVRPIFIDEKKEK